MNKLISETISFLRFPLCCAVVLLHSGVQESERISGILLSVEPFLRKFLYSGFAHISVPLFFAISGFLFFHNIEEFRINGWRTEFLRKLKSRFFSLFIPYFCWNSIAFVRMLLTQTFFDSFRTSSEKMFCYYTAFDYLDAFFCIKRDTPLCGSFWFIRDLMVLVLLSPLIFLVIKYIHQHFVILLAIIWIFITKNEMFIEEFYVLDFRSILFFSLGAWLSIKKIVFMPTLITRRNVLLILFLVLLSTWMVTDSLLLNKLSLIIGLLTTVAFSAYGIKIGCLHINYFLTSSSFFIFAYHGWLIRFINKYAGRILPVQNDVTLILTYLLTTVLIVCLGLLFYYLLRKYLPKFTAIICGSR